MTKLPIHIAHKLNNIIAGEEVASSSMKHTCVNKMVEDGVLQKRIAGKSNALYFTKSPDALAIYISNHYGINDLSGYISHNAQPADSRMKNILAGSDSKLLPVKTFQGFMISSYSPVQATLHGKPLTILPPVGTCIFINDYQQFLPDPSVIVVGIENAENFLQISRQAYLFPNITPLFVSRYPQNNSLIAWLRSIPNPYLHFGDLDFEGINIYLNEFKKHLGSRASFFLPPNYELLLEKHGNRALFASQYSRRPTTADIEPNIQSLITLILEKGKVLEQEVFINAE